MRLRGFALGAGCCALLCLPVVAQTKDVSRADSAFLKMAAETSMTEANLGQTAENQAANAGVKSFAQKLVQDETKAYQNLRAVAGKAGANVPDGINIAKNPTAEQLLRLKGQRFDRQFLQDEIRTDQRTIAVFKREAQHGQDAAVKSYASQSIPALEDHLRQAETLARSERHQ